MKLYLEYTNAIKKIGKINRAYFTTFNIDSEFVEKYILPPLLNEDIPDNKFSLEDLNLSLMKKIKPDIKFFYDVNMLLSYEKRTLVEFHPILVTSGFFHPKVIYLEGADISYLFVGSGNLTYSGWGKNIEAFKVVEITNNENLRNQVLNFYDEVFNMAGLKINRKTKRKAIYDNKIDFVYSARQDSSSWFLKNLNLNSSLQVYSPYFSDDLDNLFTSEQFQGLSTIDIVPDLIGNVKIRLKLLPEDPRISFYVNKKPDNVSINHSKIWISEKKYAIGSYNCTEAALFGKNVEASLIEEFNDINDFKLLSKNKIIPQNAESDEEMDEVPGIKKFKAIYRLVANWELRTLKFYEVISSVDIKNIKILLPSLSETVSHKELDNFLSIKKEQIFRALIKNKNFIVKDEKNELLFEGFIVEIEATQSNRVSLQAETLDDIFLSFQDEKNPTSGKSLDRKNLNFDNADEQTYNKKSSQNNLNYFNMFNGFKNLNSKFEEMQNKDNFEDFLNKFSFYSASSLAVMVNIIIKELENHQNLFMHLTIIELNGLIKKVNKHLDKAKQFQQIKSHVNLEPNDLKFMESVYAKTIK